MTSEHNTARKGQEISGTGNEKIGKRGIEGLKLSDIEEWTPIEGGVYTVGEVGGADLSADINTAHGGLLLERRDLSAAETTVSAFYMTGGVFISAQAEGGEESAEMTVRLPAGGARELAFSLLQAAEEYERRPKEQ